MQYSLTFYENLQICEFPSTVQFGPVHCAQNPINGSKKKKAHVTTLSLDVCTSGRVHNGINVVCVD